MKNIGTIILISLVLSPAIIGKTVTDKNQEPNEKKTYALVVSGISKDLQHRSAKSKVLSDLQRLLLNTPEISGETLTVLVADGLPADGAFRTSTA